MTGDHHRRVADTATLLLTAMDGILGTHKSLDRLGRRRWRRGGPAITPSQEGRVLSRTLSRSTCRLISFTQMAAPNLEDLADGVTGTSSWRWTGR